MKKSHKAIVSSRFIALVLFAISFNSCTLTSKLFIEEDIVYSTKRAELTYGVKDTNPRSPLNFFRQSVVKEIKINNEITYTAYDILYLSKSSFRLEDRVFLIIDDNPFQMTINKKEIDYLKSISEDKTDILATDSTTVSVTTGYSESESKITRLTYEIPEEVIARIKTSNKLMIRYYSGPSMITVKVRYQTLRKLKRLIEMN